MRKLLVVAVLALISSPADAKRAGRRWTPLAVHVGGVAQFGLLWMPLHLRRLGVMSVWSTTSTPRADHIDIPTSADRVE